MSEVPVCNVLGSVKDNVVEKFEDIEAILMASESPTRNNTNIYK